MATSELKPALLALALLLGGCNLGSAVEACSEDADCPEGSTCDAELAACVRPAGEPDLGLADAGNQK
jgi:Cys-rich repeat protein